MSYEEIILMVKTKIFANGIFDETCELLTLDCNNIDHIAESIAEDICGGEEC